ncbi:MAG TPA: glycine--tRNA ligase subunit beta, partial [Thermoanaerobaculia bacterium]
MSPAEARGEYLLEVRSEEIPARMLPGATRELATRLFEELMARGLGPREVDTGYTPRRLVLVLSGLPEREPDRDEQVMGPPARAGYGPDGAPTQALLGFARRCGVAPEALARVQTEKGEYLAATKRTAGRATAEVLAELVPRILAALSWPKTMRWGSGEGPWVRPVHGIVSLFDGRPVPFTFFGVETGDRTVGHPVLSPQEFQVRGAEQYRQELATRRIEVRPAVRKTALLEGMRERAESLGGTLVDDPALLEKLVALCEIPGVLEGEFDPSYLELPREVLVTSLRDHQSAFTVAGRENGGLLPSFLTVMDRPDDPAGRVRAGNEWVVAARLADAGFFYAEDRKVPLAARAGQLAHLGFHEALGSYAAKADRLEALAGWIARRLGWEEEAGPAEEAARLLKLDLTTDMVKEFTSLQGVMGGIYLREQGVEEAVWQAVYDQYLPASTEDPIPRGRVGRVAGLADRLDTLVGFFGLGLVPTGSRDPYGLRRAAQGVVRIALEGEIALDLDAAAAQAVALYGAKLTRAVGPILADLRPFLADRVRYLLGLAGYAYDEIEAALAVGWSELPDLRARVDAVHKAREEEGFLTVALAAKRIANILRGVEEELALDEALLVEAAEQDLFAAYEALAAEVEAGSARHDHEGVLRQVAHLAPVLDRFFVEVLVMAPDERLRTNRLALLQH